MPLKHASKLGVVFWSLLMLSLGSLYGETTSGHIRNPKPDILLFKATSGLTLPIGQEDSELFKPGFYAGLTGEIGLSGLPLLYVILSAGYTRTPLMTGSGDLSLHLLDAGGGLGLDWPVAGGLHLGAFLKGGYAFGFIPDQDNIIAQQVVSPQTTDSTWFTIGGGFMRYKFNPLFSIQADGSFRFYSGLRTAITVALGLVYHPDFTTDADKYKLKKPTLQLLKLTDIYLEAVFPVFYKYYDEHPIGSIQIENTSSKTINNLVVSFFVKEYMDNPKTCATLEKLAPGEKKRIQIYSLLTQKVLSISESTKVSANIFIETEQDGVEYQNEHIQTLRLHDRNAMTWDDDRRAAAFVTMKDPTVLKFSKYVSNLTRDKASKAINQNFLLGLSIFEALRLYGLNYAIDPSSPYKESSQKAKLTVDFLQFPNQTLAYKTGDCDDLSILFCALLEAVGVKTAFITIPGHIYMAFSLDLTQQDAKRVFTNPNELLFIDGNAWLPVEITMLRDGFLKAWPQGAKQWNEYAANKQIGFYPVQAAWQVYEPVGFSGTEDNLDLPAAEALLQNYLATVDKFVKKELSTRVFAMEEKIKKSTDDLPTINQLGVLYARYGKTDQAKEQFKAILARKEYLPALVNLGHIYYLEDNYKDALQYYERAFKMDIHNASVLLSLAKTYNELENYKLVKEYYTQLKKVDNTLAMQSAYLDLNQQEPARASNRAAGKEFLRWEE